MTYRRLGLAALLLLGCHHDHPNASVPDATVAHADAARAGETAVTTAPESLLLVIRGSTLRRAMPLLFPQGGAAEVVSQLSRQVTPGIGNHNDEVDIDSPFAVAGTMGGAGESTLTLYVAWPLRPGMQIAQDARSLHGYRRAGDGLYAPTSPDAGAGSENQCWVGQRQPVGWMLLCGPSDGIAQVAGFLHAQAVTGPDNAAILDIDVRTGELRRLMSHQLADLDAQQPPHADGGVEAVRRAMFEDARRTVSLLSALANDAETFHGAVTQDENAMHLRAELVLSHLTSDASRALVSASAGRMPATALVQLLPGSVTSWMADGFDRTQANSVFGASSVDPSIAMQAGPELAHILQVMDELKSPFPLGERVDAYSPEDGYTMYHIIRQPDAARFVSDVRIALNSVPARALPEGGTLRDVATALPTPGLTGNVLRIGRNVHIPPGVQVPPEVRAMIERSMLLVADGDHLIAIAARDPVARYQAMSQGPRASATLAPDAVISGHVIPGAFAPVFMGAQIPGLPESHTTDAVDFSLRVERRGEGARAELTADAPIGAAVEMRATYAMIQEIQARMMQQMMQQQQQMQRQGAMRPQRLPQQEPQLEPGMLPPPPRLQLQAPQ